MTRGNQREIDRVRAQKRAAKNAPKGATSGQDLQTRKERDADIMRQKQQKSKPEKGSGQEQQPKVKK